ncbi:MAG: IS30 family transposase [Candidatus Synoicihabitans palmerolidicus]|nr:IS30 family transposase [Candidatus Synoicihabitans palmerolidicus]
MRAIAPPFWSSPNRVSRYVMIVPLGGAKDAISVARALIRAFKRLPAHLRKTLTYDNGREMAQHAAFSLATKVAVYFCNPHNPWQRGAVANINGLIREYFPKGIDFNTVTKSHIAKAEWLLNNLPRIGLDGQSPAEVFSCYYTKGLCTSRLTLPCRIIVSGRVKLASRERVKTSHF